jgi:hypothetical protein
MHTEYRSGFRVLLGIVLFLFLPGANRDLWAKDPDGFPKPGSIKGLQVQMLDDAI